MSASKRRTLAGLNLASVVLVCLFLAAGCGGKGDDPIVIKMKGQSVTLSEIKEAYDRVGGEGAYDNATIPERLDFVETWADKEILKSEAMKHVKEPSETTRVQLTRYRERFLVTAFWKQMSEGVTVPQDTIDCYRDILRKQMLLSVIQVSEEEEARDLLRGIESGASFESLARLHSEDRYTKDAGGRTGWVGPGGGPLPMVARHAFGSLEKGQITEEPFQTPKGFFIVRVDDVRMLESTPQLEQQWLVTARQTFFRNRTQAIRDSVAEGRKLSIRSEALEPLRRVFFDYWDSLNTLQMTTGSVPYMALEPPSKEYWTTVEWGIPIVSFSDESWSIGDFVESLRGCDLEFWVTKSTDTEQIRRNVERRMLRYFMTLDAADWGWEKDPWYVQRFDRQKERRLLDDYHDGVLAKEVTISDADIQSFIESSPGSFIQGDMVDFGFILFPADAGEQAAEALRSLRGGEGWDDVGQNQALRSPEVSFVGATGLSAGDQHPDLARLAKHLVDSGRLPLNTYSDLMQSRRGLVILRVTSRVRGEPMPRAVAERYARSTLRDHRVEALLQQRIPSLRTEYSLEIVTEPLEKDVLAGSRGGGS